MKTYFKVLATSVLILIVFSSIGFLAEKMIPPGHSSIAPTIIWLIGLVLGNLSGIVLPLKMCKTAKSKILTIFLLPTNYVLIAFLMK